MLSTTNDAQVINSGHENVINYPNGGQTRTSRRKIAEGRIIQPSEWAKFDIAMPMFQVAMHSQRRARIDFESNDNKAIVKDRGIVIDATERSDKKRKTCSQQYFRASETHCQRFDV